MSISRWGANIGSLRISAIQNTPTGPQTNLLWERNETQSRQWRTEQINLRDIPYDFAMKIDGFVGSGYEGDVCLILLGCSSSFLLTLCRSRSMRSISWKANVLHQTCVTSNCLTVDGPTIQALNSIGHGLKRPPIPSALDRPLVNMDQRKEGDLIIAFV